MKRIDGLDFLQSRPTPWLGWVAAGIGMLVLAVTALPLMPLAAGNQALARDLQAPVVDGVEPVPAANVQMQQDQARRLLRPLDAPWRELFALLERHADPQIGLLHLEPDAATGQFRMTGLSRSLPAMAAWLRRLEQDPQLSEVQILQHQIEDLAPGRPVRFSLSARWRGSRPGDQPVDRSAAPLRARLTAAEARAEAGRPDAAGAMR